MLLASSPNLQWSPVHWSPVPSGGSQEVLQQSTQSCVHNFSLPPQVCMCYPPFQGPGRSPQPPPSSPRSPRCPRCALFLQHALSLGIQKPVTMPLTSLLGKLAAPVFCGWHPGTPSPVGSPGLHPLLFPSTSFLLPLRMCTFVPQPPGSLLEPGTVFPPWWHGLFTPSLPLTAGVTMSPVRDTSTCSNRSEIWPNCRRRNSQRGGP